MINSIHNHGVHVLVSPVNVRGWQSTRDNNVMPRRTLRLSHFGKDEYSKYIEVFSLQTATDILFNYPSIYG